MNAGMNMPRYEVSVHGLTRLFYFFSVLGARAFVAQQLPNESTIYDLREQRYVHFERPLPKRFRHEPPAPSLADERQRVAHSAFFHEPVTQTLVL